jgi:hypothetical protein
VMNCAALAAIRCEWNTLAFPHSNRFLTFLQACTVLRARRGIRHNDFHGGVQDAYDKCPLCRAAYEVMRAPGQPWSPALSPWFSHLDTMSGNAAYAHDDPYEYAHWFGYILTPD